MTIGIFCPTDGESSITIKTLRKFIEVFSKKNIKVKVLLAGSNGHYSNELDKLNIDYKTLHANHWIYPAYSKSFSAANHTEETFKFTVPIANQFAEWNVDLILSISMLSNSGAIASTLINKPHIWFINESLDENTKYKGYFDHEHYKNLVESSAGLIFDNYNNLFNLIDSKLKNTFTFKRLESFTEDLVLDTFPKVDIILPFYNDSNIFECIKSIKAHKTDSLQNIIVVMDKGPDEALNSQIRNVFSNDTLVKIIENDVNYGFVHTCNVGMQNSVNDVVLLNTDTIPGPFWLENLQKAIYSDNKIMTASPLSNSTEDLSIPSIKHNQNIDVDLIATIFNKYVSQKRIEVHSAHGFCMYIKRKVIDEIGLLNEKEFGKGYGEENEFCFRIRDKGYINILVGNSFVKHLGSRSFTSEAKLELKKKNSSILKERYPFMVPELLDFIRVSPLAEISNILKFFTKNSDLVNKNFSLLSADLRNNRNVEQLIQLANLKPKTDTLVIEGPYSIKSKERLQKIFSKIHFLGYIENPQKIIEVSDKFFIDKNYRLEELSLLAKGVSKNPIELKTEREQSLILYKDINLIPDFITATLKDYSLKKITTPFYSPTMVKHFMKKNVLKSAKAYIVRVIEHNRFTLKLWIEFNKGKKKVRKFFRKSPMWKKVKKLLGRS